MVPIAALAVLAASGSSFLVGKQSGRVLDQQGRERLFHGVNAVEKLQPFIVDINNCNRSTSLCPGDAEKLAGWGLNVVRLGVLWAGTFPNRRGEVNHTYLSQVKRVIDMLEEQQIYTIVDMHQDVLHPRTCGEGLPTWAYLLALESVGFDTNDSSKAFPKPLPFKIERDPASGLPTQESCQKYPFATYYAASESDAAWKALATSSAVWDAMAEHWGAVAGALKGSTGVLGFELINEPWGTKGSILKSYFSFIPLYQRCAAAIREIDASRVILFEGPTQEGMKSSELPAYGIEGEDKADRELFSYHSYCPGKNGSPNMFECKLMVGGAWKDLDASLAHLKLGGFLTEFGAVADDNASVDLLQLQGDFADQHVQSWAYWTYRSYDDITTINSENEGFFNADGTVKLPKVKALSRTYAQATAGHILSMEFDSASGAFSLSYNSTTASAPTEVFVSPFYYPNRTGYTVGIKPLGAATAALDPKRPGLLVITHTNTTAAGTVLNVTVTAS